MLRKSQWNIDGDSMQVSLPIQKVDKEQRTVSGFATLDNVDGHGDVVTASASGKAFSRWRGNIREMHQPIAVGKAVSFTEEEFYDPIDDKTYKGIFVTVRVSKGAQDTWEKVLDGTLTGFSIGGKVLKKSETLDKDTGDLIRYIEDYELQELSLVDSPANNYANVLSIQKTADGVEGTGIATMLKGENAMYCADDDILLFTADEARDCVECETEMKNIGWVESGSDKVDVAKSLVQAYKDSHPSEGAPAILHKGEYVISKQQVSEIAAEIIKEIKGGANVADENEKTVEAVEPEPVETPAEETAENKEVEETSAEETVEKAADVEEVQPQPAVDVDALTKALGEQVTQAVTDAVAKSSAAVEEVKTSLTEALADVTKQISELQSKVDSEFSTLGGRVETIETATAVKKSEDLGGSEEEVVQKSIWSGRFLGVQDLTT